MRSSEGGFTLVEILISLAIFVIVVVGGLTALGAVATGGLLDTIPTGFTTGRTAKDYTAASAFLQGFHEHLASLGSASLTPPIGPQCPWTFDRNATDAFGFQLPAAAGEGTGFRLNWTKLTVVFERWNWVAPRYVPGGSCVPPASGQDALILVTSTLTWEFKGERPPLTVQRFIPRTP